MLQALRRESPKLGGSFANWGLTFSLFDCSLQYLRKKVRLANAAPCARSQLVVLWPVQIESGRGPAMHGTLISAALLFTGGSLERDWGWCTDGRVPAAAIGAAVSSKVCSIWRRAAGEFPLVAADADCGRLACDCISGQGVLMKQRDGFVLAAVVSSGGLGQLGKMHSLPCTRGNHMQS